MFEPLSSRRLMAVAPLLADFNSDGGVDNQDFVVLAQNFNTAGDHSAGDANGDSIVNAMDFNAVASEFGRNIHGTLIFSDEFIGTTLNPVWTPSQYWWPDDHTVVGQGELEAYDATAVSVNNGQLHLTARKETKYGVPYVSGLVQIGGKQDHPTWPRFSFLHGYLEARIKLPAGQGLWPAIWLMPASFHDANGELDVMENLGSAPSKVYFTAHRNSKTKTQSFTGPDFSAGFHTLAVDWQADHITWFVDGVARATTADTTLICPEASYPILNLAVGGSWPGSPDASSQFPASMDVDYVRVYQ